MKPIHCAIVGCGNISDVYIKNILRFTNLKLMGCSDILREKAEEKAQQYNLNVYDTNDVFDSDNIDLIINLTIPSSHFEVSLKALEHGKHVYSEKPLALTNEHATTLLEIANKNSLFVGCAPDTFLGASWQTAKKLINDGWIGKPLSATAFMLCHGHESWHPSPEFYYQKGGGPLFDMGPYYLTVLIYLLGPVKSVFAVGKKSFDTRLTTSMPKFGEKVIVEIPTHIHATLCFENNIICTLIVSFDTWAHRLPYVEIYGEKGSLSLPDPNQFFGTTYYYNQYMKEWKEVPTCYDIFTNMRGIGISDMATAIQEKRQFLANGELARHVVDIMEKIQESVTTGEHLQIETTCPCLNVFNRITTASILPDGKT
ncbi:MAG TPA: Gfo/Idh/MocA family oxidoreductase [Candidatus Hydrogenedens sp.]|nr:Gfo/Idh/MocA family oxidoreductase [Candidatus Hydrogenedens sp.]HOL19917.1 Gfo/Idh/MocA family oxidoreductase [Candidatus Hydrogenedens sp.]